MPNAVIRGVLLSVDGCCDHTCICSQACRLTHFCIDLLKDLDVEAKVASEAALLTNPSDVQATSASFNPHSTRHAAQLLAVRSASTEALPPKSSSIYLCTFKKLFGGLLHPDATTRMTAAQMLELLQNAALKRLKKRPFCI